MNNFIWTEEKLQEAYFNKLTRSKLLCKS